jgi:CHAD domain-containing protein
MSPSSHDPRKSPDLKVSRRSLQRLARHTLRDQLQTLQKLIRDLERKKEDTVETTHQLRVTSRRADVTLRLFKHWLPERRRRWMRTTMRSLRHQAGAVRDLDLLEQKWTAPHGIAAQQVTPAAAEWFAARIDAARTDAVRTLVRWTRSSTRRRLKHRARRTVAQVRARRPHAVSTVSRKLSDLVDDFLQSLPAAAQSLPHSHETRIRARRLRYALELLTPVLPNDPSATCSWLADIQEQLGQINDDATSIRFLRESLEECPNSAVRDELQAVIDHSASAAARRLEQYVADIEGHVQILQQAIDGWLP